MEVTIPTSFSGGSINVPDQPMLRNKRITALEIYTHGDIQYSPLTGNPVANNIECSQMFFNGYTADPVAENDMGEYLYRLPLLALHSLQNSSGDTFVQRVNSFDELFIQWDKCSISLQGFAAVGNPIAVLFNVYYTSEQRKMGKHMHPHKSGIRGVDGGIMDIMAQKIMSLENALRDLLAKKQQ